VRLCELSLKIRAANENAADGRRHAHRQRHGAHVMEQAQRVIHRRATEVQQRRRIPAHQGENSGEPT